MKKIVLSFALCLMTLGVYADGSVSMGTAQVKQGKTALVEVNYEITSGSYSAVELYFSMPEGVEVVTTDEDASGAVVKATGENSGMQFILKKSSLFTGAYASNSYVLLGYSGNLTSSGTLCSITIRAAATTAIADYDAILNDNTEACVAGHACFDTPTKFDLTTSVPFTVSVVEDALDLYDTDTALPVASSESKVIIHRNFKENVWNTFVAPFAISEAQYKAAFGNDVQVAAFTGQNVSNPDEEIVLTFTSTTETEANTPVLVKPSANKTSATFTGSITVDPDDASMYIGKNAVRTYMIGTYVPTQIKSTPETVDDDPVYVMYLKDNDFYYAPKAGVNLKGYRCYFQMAVGYSPFADNFHVRMAIDEDPTAIESIDADYENGMVYTIDGKFVGKDVNLNRMQKGVYIVNGKKFINK